MCKALGDEEVHQRVDIGHAKGGEEEHMDGTVLDVSLDPNQGVGTYLGQNFGALEFDKAPVVEDWPHFVVETVVLMTVDQSLRHPWHEKIAREDGCLNDWGPNVYGKIPTYQ